MRNARVIATVISITAGFLAYVCTPAIAQSPQPSTCLAVAQNLQSPDFPPVHFASFSAQPAAVSDAKYQVTISFQGHSTYLIESAGGVKIATDYAGYMAANIVPTAVTMNQAHSSHYTDYPNEKIPHVLRGWGPNGTPAEHHVTIDDVLIRNVTTDILRFSSIPDGNSIFIFEVAGLCIGHLGHLHHKLTDSHYAKIGRLDVVMVPVDGGRTLAHTSLKELLERMRSSVILPMHVRFGGALPQFLAYLGEGTAIESRKENKLILSLRNLPKQPTVILLPGVSSYPAYEE